jgi:hypothetical protein
MKTILSLSDEAKTARLMLKDVALGELAVRESEADAGCNCDRWGHPCPGCVGRNIPTEAGATISSTIKE